MDLFSELEDDDGRGSRPINNSSDKSLGKTSTEKSNKISKRIEELSGTDIMSIKNSRGGGENYN